MKNIARVKVKIRGTRAYLQHGFGEDAIPLPNEKREKTGVAGNDPEEWKRTRMITRENQLYMLPTYIFATLRDGAKHTKAGRANLQKKVQATLEVKDEIILLDQFMPDEKEVTRLPTDPVYVDVRMVRNPGTGGRNIRYRLAAKAGWTCEFTIEFDWTVVTRAQMQAILRDAGKLEGVGNGRAIGMGRFEVISWEELKDAKDTTAA